MAMACTVTSESVEGESKERESQLPASTTRSKERLKPGNLKGRSLAVMREQNNRPLFQVEESPLV